MFSSQCPRACHVIISFSFSSSTKVLKVPSTTQRLSVFVGHSPGVGYPSSRFIPDKLLSPWRVSSGDQPDSLSPGSIYNIYKWLFTISINFNFFLLFVLFSSRTQQLKGKGIGQHDMQYDTMHSHDQPEFYDPEGIQEDRGQMQKHRSTRSWTWHTQNKTTCTLQRQA